jgi:glycosyltransferase involved in cell wall biosynthesis
MKVTFIVNLDPKTVKGLFVSSHNRIKQFQKHNEYFEVYNLNFYDGKILKFIKKNAGLRILEAMERFIYEDINYPVLNIRHGLLSYFACKLHLQYYLYFFYAYSARRKFKDSDLISAHWGLYPGLFAYWLKKLLNKKIAVTYHGSDIHTTPYVDKGWEKAVKHLLKESDGNVFVSHELLNQAFKLGFVCNPTIIRNGIDRAVFKRLSDKDIGLQKEKYHINGKVIGFVGNLVDVKNARLLPAIFREIAGKLNMLCFFIIIGDGLLRNHIEKQSAELSLQTLFTGDIPVNDVAKFMSCMDLMILPSKNEGSGMVLLEALSCKCPCVGSRVGGIPENIGIENTVLLSENEDLFIKEIADLAVKRIINPKSFFESCLIHPYDWEEVFQEEKDFYISLI